VAPPEGQVDGGKASGTGSRVLLWNSLLASRTEGKRPGGCAVTPVEGGKKREGEIVNERTRRKQAYSLKSREMSERPKCGVRGTIVRVEG